MPIVQVDSAQRSVFADGPEEYTFNLRDPFKGVRKMQLVAASVPRTMFNVYGSFNGYFSILFAGPETDDIVIPDGYYTGTQLAAEITTQLAAGGTEAALTTVTFDSDTGKFTWTNSAATVITSITASVFSARVLGLEATTTDPSNDLIIVYAPAAAAFTGPNVIQLNYPEYLLMKFQVQEQGSGGNVKSHDSDYTYIIPMPVAYGETAELREGSDFLQTDFIPVDTADNFVVKWYTPDLECDHLWSFQGADNRLTFRCL